jgi:hypothetical protein
MRRKMRNSPSCRGAESSLPTQRHLAVGIAGLRAEVMTMDPAQFMPGEETQPQKKGQFTLAQVLGQLGEGLQVDVLEDVRGIDPALQPDVKAQSDHAAQPVAIAGQQGAPVGLAALGGTGEQLNHFSGIVSHCEVHCTRWHRSAHGATRARSMQSVCSRGSSAARFGRRLWRPQAALPNPQLQFRSRNTLKRPPTPHQGRGPASWSRARR